MPRNGAAIVRRTSKTDNYSTPAWATEGLLDREKFEGLTLEPACGEGKMAEVLRDRGMFVLTSDIRDIEAANMVPVDFLCGGWREDFSNVITNPPFSLALEFAEKALKITTRKVALLLRIQFLESQKRRPFLESSPLARIYVFSSRLSMYPEGVENRGDGTQCFSWYVWEHGYTGEPVVRWIP